MTKIREDQVLNLVTDLAGKSPIVELFPHTIASGAGTEGSPYTHADNTGGIQTEINAQAAGRGGSVKLAAGRFNVTTPITITSNGIKLEGVVAGYNADPNAQSQGINGSSLIVTGNAISISGTGYPVGRTTAVQLSSLYLFGTTTRQSIGSSTGTIGVKLQSFIDQPTLRNVNIGGFDYGIKSVNSASGWVDFSYFQQVEIQGGRVGVYYDNAGWGNFGQHYIACAIAETDEHNVYVTSASTNENFVFSATAFYRGSSAASVTNPANVYFAGTRSRFEGCEFVAAGYAFIANTHVIADGLILAGDYNTVSGCAFLDNNGVSGQYGIRVSGSHNTITGCVFNNNNKDILVSGSNNVISGCNYSIIDITGNNNIIYVPVGATVTDSGTGNTIIGDKTILKPTLSTNAAGFLQGMLLSPTLTTTANNIPVYGLDITSSYVGGIGTVGITNAGSSYTNGTYTSVPLNSAVQGSGALATVVVSGGAVTSVTVTTAGSLYKLGGTITILSSSIGGTGSSFSSYITLLNFSGSPIAGLRVDGIPIGTGAGAGMNYGNIAIGLNALQKNTVGGGGTGGANAVVGYTAMAANTTGSGNTAIGTASLTSNTTGFSNTGIGSGALSGNTTGTNNTAVGQSALAAMQTNSTSTAVGYIALQNDQGGENTAIGGYALANVTSGNHNVGMGRSTGFNITTGTYNTFVGWYVGIGITTGSKNTIIGSMTQGFTSSLSNNVILADGDGNMRVVINNLGNGYFGAAGTYPTIGSDKLEIAGSLKVDGSLSTAYVAKSASYTLTITDATVGASGAANTQTLPTAVGITGRQYTIKNIDASANAITVATTSSQTIDGSTTYSLTARYKYVTVQSDGANWMIIANN